MHDKKKLWLWIGIVVVAGLAIIFVGGPLLSGAGGSADPLDQRRETPTPRAAPGSQMPSGTAVSEDD